MFVNVGYSWRHMCVLQSIDLGNNLPTSLYRYEQVQYNQMISCQDSLYLSHNYFGVPAKNNQR